MSDIRVQCAESGTGWSCRVTVAEGGSQTDHEVTVSSSELERLAPAKGEPARLVEASFRYLLEREPKESILRRFPLSEIERYFPDYADEIRRRLER